MNFKHETHQVLDSTKLNSYQVCPRKCFWQFVAGWVPDTTIHNLSFGRAVHIALEVLYNEYKEKGSYTDAALVRAFSAFLKDYRKEYAEETDSIFHPKDPESFLLMLEQYAQYWEDTDRDKNLKVLYTEISGSIPLNIEGTKKLNFRLDTVCKNDYGYFILEHKTSQWRMDLWTTSWDLSMQAGMGNYVMKCRYGQESAGIIYNGLFFRKELKRSKSQNHEFLRYPVRMGPIEIQRWLETTTHYYDSYMENLELFYKESQEDKLIMRSFPQNPSGCLSYNKVCEYHDFCVGTCNPCSMLESLPEGFKYKFWDPKDDDSNVVDVGEVK